MNSSDIKGVEFDGRNGLMMTLVGPRNSGKSTLMKNLVQNFFMKSKARGGVGIEEEYIYILCPTCQVTTDWDFLSSAKKIKNVSPQYATEMIQEQERLFEMYGEERVPQLLIIFDDCLDVDSSLIRFGSSIDALASRGRHYKINVMIASQRLKGVSITARNNSDYFIMFRPFAFREAEKFVQEFFSSRKRDAISDRIQSIWEEPYAFICIDNKCGAADKLKLRFGEAITL